MNEQVTETESFGESWLKRALYLLIAYAMLEVVIGPIHVDQLYVVSIVLAGGFVAGVFVGYRVRPRLDSVELSLPF